MADRLADALGMIGQKNPHKTPQMPRKKPLSSGLILDSLAERVGFEPTVRKNRTPDFESGAFDHSATFPGC